jgi:hypothetical protein
MGDRLTGRAPDQVEIPLTPAPLRGDCAQCAALCCVAPAFDRSPMFAIDKPAGEPCPNLDASCRCRIHADRSAQGFAGCVAYDCLGAGQYVTQAMFAGRSWRDDPALLEPMTRAFSAVRQAHEAMLLLDQAKALPLPAEAREALQRCGDRLHPDPAWTLEDVAEGRLAAAVSQALGVLRGLRDYVRRPAADGTADRP